MSTNMQRSPVSRILHYLLFGLHHKFHSQHCGRKDCERIQNRRHLCMHDDILPPYPVGRTYISEGTTTITS
jgi:hypothetical protein